MPETIEHSFWWREGQRFGDSELVKPRGTTRREDLGNGYPSPDCNILECKEFATQQSRWDLHSPVDGYVRSDPSMAYVEKLMQHLVRRNVRCWFALPIFHLEEQKDVQWCIQTALQLKLEQLPLAWI